MMISSASSVDLKALSKRGEQHQPHFTAWGKLRHRAGEVTWSPTRSPTRPVPELGIEGPIQCFIHSLGHTASHISTSKSTPKQYVFVHKTPLTCGTHCHMILSLRLYQDAEKVGIFRWRTRPAAVTLDRIKIKIRVIDSRHKLTPYCLGSGRNCPMGRISHHCPLGGGGTVYFPPPQMMVGYWLDLALPMGLNSVASSLFPS